MFFRWMWASLLLCLLPFTVQADQNCRRSLSASQLCPNPMIQNSPESVGMKTTDLKCNYYGNNKNLTLVGIHVSEDRWQFDEVIFSECQFFLQLDNNNPETDVCEKSFEMTFEDGGVFDHNFTLDAENGFEMEDFLSTKNVDLICDAKQRYVSMLFMSYKDDGCSIIIRQHSVNLDKSECNNNSPFCGVYPCSRLQSLLLDFKLSKEPRKQEVDGIENEPKIRTPWYKDFGQKWFNILNGTFTGNANNETKFGCDFSLENTTREQSIVLAISIVLFMLCVFRIIMLSHLKSKKELQILKDAYKNGCPMHPKIPRKSTLPMDDKKQLEV